MVLATLWCVLFIWALFFGDRVKRWVDQLKLPALALSVISLELWSVHTQQDFWLALLGVLSTATFLLSRR